MTTWFDLPVEVKQSILEYVVSTIAIKFTPRHGGTRSSRAKEAKTADDESAAKKADAVSSLLLVSKRFLSYLEPEPALLSDAIISISEPRCLTHKIDKRFSNDVLAGIRELKITHDVLPPNQNRRPGATSLLPADHFLTTRMPSLQKITIHYVEPRHPWLNECQLSFQQALTVADGSPVPRSEYPEGPWSWYQSHLFESDDPTFLARRVTQSLFFDFLRVMSFRAGKYLFRFLNVEGDASTYERVLKWTSSLTWAAPRRETTE